MMNPNERAQAIGRRLNRRMAGCVLLEQEVAIAHSVREGEVAIALDALEWAAYHYVECPKPRDIRHAAERYLLEHETLLTDRLEHS